jgi:hypothetical protein
MAEKGSDEKQMLLIIVSSSAFRLPRHRSHFYFHLHSQNSSFPTVPMAFIFCSGKAGKSHNTGYLKRQRGNRLGHSTGVEGKKIEQRVRKLLGVF